MGSLPQLTIMFFICAVYIAVFVLIIIVVLSIKRIAKSQEEIAVTNKDIAKQLTVIAAGLQQKNI